MPEAAWTATELAQAIARREVSSADAVEARLARIDAVNGALNAVVLRRDDAARQEARAADEKLRRGEPIGPLHGVPVTIKECLDLAGTPSTFGIPSRASHRAQADETHVARLRAAGAIVIGKTNVSQCLFYTEADNPLYGRTNNPWNPQRTCGGSSGGEGAIIAAGGSILGLGTDIGGSVRVPAAFCGIASLKPTSGRMDDPGEFSCPPGQRAIPSQVGVLARTTADVALGYRVAAGIAGDLQHVDVAKLRIGFYVDDGSFAPAPAAQRAVREAVAALADAGAKVQEWRPPAVSEAFTIFGGILMADGGAHVRRILAGNPKTPQIKQLLLGGGTPAAMVPALQALLRAVGQPGLAFNLGAFGPPTADRYFERVEEQRLYREAFERATRDFDVLLAPPVSLPAFTHGATRDLLTAGAYAPLYNLLGWPAGVVPVTRVRPGEESARPASPDMLQKLAKRIETGSAGLPIGVQVIAKPWQEHVALAAMHAVQTTARRGPDFPRTPIPE